MTKFEMPMTLFYYQKDKKFLEKNFEIKLQISSNGYKFSTLSKCKIHLEQYLNKNQLEMDVNEYKLLSKNNNLVANMNFSIKI